MTNKKDGLRRPVVGMGGKAVDCMLTVDAEIHDAVIALPPDERRDREKVNEAVREGLRLGPAAPCRQ